MINGYSKGRLVLCILESLFDNFKIVMDPYLHYLADSCIHFLFGLDVSITNNDNAVSLKYQAALFLAKIVNK